MKKLLLFITVLFSCSLIQSQVTLKWSHMYPGAGNDVAIDPAGNIYACGTSTVETPDFMVVKYKSNGLIIWQRVIGIDSLYLIETAHSISVDNMGNVYATGYMHHHPRTGYDYLTVKYDSAGVLQWMKFYGEEYLQDDYAMSIAVDNSGNVYVTGMSMGNGTDFDYATIKYSPEGTFLWAQRYDGPAHSVDKAWALSVDNSGNVYVTGLSKGVGSDYDFATVKYNSAGVQQWVKRYNGPVSGYDEAHEIDVDGSGNVYVTGHSEGTDGYDLVTIKYCPIETQNWTKRYDRWGNSDEYGKDIKVDMTGNVYVTGYSYTGPFLFDMITIKYNQSGVRQWIRIYNNPDNLVDWAERMVMDVSGNIYITGYSATGLSDDDDDYTVVKYSPSGLRLWVAKYNGPADKWDRASSIAVKDSVIVVSGSSKSFDNRFYLNTVKYTQQSFQLTIQQKITNLKSEVQNLVNWGNLNQGNGNALNAKLNAAIQKVNQGNNNAAINQLSAFNNQVDAFVRTGRLVSEYGETLTAEAEDIIQELNRDFSLYNEAPLSYMLAQNYPNPFNPVTSISFSLPAREFVTITVYDILGNEVEVLVNEFMNTGSHNISWDASRFASGVYFYRVNAGRFTETKKMVLIK